jgi:hypothetical protein
MAEFLKKWSEKKAVKPKVGTQDAVETFKTRVIEQKAYLAEYERDADGFRKWRSTWFQKVPGGFGVTVGRDGVDAGNGLSYVILSSTKEISDFLDDLTSHADTDISFQRALEENRLKRVARLGNAKVGVKARKSKPKSSDPKSTQEVASSSSPARKSPRSAPSKGSD